MASVCINNVGMSPENFLDCPPAYPSHGWLSPRVSFSRDFTDDGGKNGGEKQDQEESVMDFDDFEFRLDDPVTMLSADELFSNGKLVPLHLVPIQEAAVSPVEIRSPASVHLRRREEVSGPDIYAFSPKAPRCSSRWKELLGLKKAQRTEADRSKFASFTSNVSNSKSLKHFLPRSSRSSSIDSTLSFPLLRDTDYESVTISARASLSSSSSSATDHDDLPRLSLDCDKIIQSHISPCRNPSRASVAKARSLSIRRPSELSTDGNITMRVGQSQIRRAAESALDGHAVVRDAHTLMRHSEPGDLPPLLDSSVESPRLNASGKVIFQGLGRSSSSPSTFNGGPRARRRGMERSYSANVLVTPVLNVPVCSLRGTAKSVSTFGIGQFFSQQKREKESSSTTKNGTSNSNAVTSR